MTFVVLRAPMRNPSTLTSVVPVPRPVLFGCNHHLCRFEKYCPLFPGVFMFHCSSNWCADCPRPGFVKVHVKSRFNIPRCHKSPALLSCVNTSSRNKIGSVCFETSCGQQIHEGHNQSDEIISCDDEACSLCPAVRHCRQKHRLQKQTRKTLATMHTIKSPEALETCH